MHSVLQDVIQHAEGFVELRYHAKTYRSIQVRNGRMQFSVLRQRSGVAARVLHQGTWGFASTGDLDARAVRTAIAQARACARATAGLRKNQIGQLSRENLAQGDFSGPGIDDVLNRSLEERVALVVDTEAALRSSSSLISSAYCTYKETFEEKAIVTTDGANATYRLVRPELSLQAVAEQGAKHIQVREGAGVNGDWSCLFRTSPQERVARLSRTAVDLLTAGHPEGGTTTLILAPSIVGLLVHEAIGHTVEADFVQAGSVAQGKLGQQVASPLVTLCDSGSSPYQTGATGTQPVDDEGVLTQRTVIIERGILKSYLHNRETASHFGVAPTGNARAWEYADHPLIRMRNTYIEPGTAELDEMIATTRNGYLLDGPRNGQADATGEFTFGVTTARRIRDGKLGELVRGVTVSGNAFQVLGTIDAVSSAFRWDLGSGLCGKGQPAKVDAGGPYIRCRALLGGQQA